MGTPVVGNIDNDEDLEVIFSGYTPSGDIFAINMDGSDVDGFPANINEKVLNGPAVIDINNNNKDDIIVATESDNMVIIVYDDGSTETIFISDDKFKVSPSVLFLNEEPIIIIGNDNHNLYALRQNGNINFTYQTDGAISTSIGFTNISNGMIGLFFGSEDGYLYGIDHYGNDLPGWPVYCGGQVKSTPSFSDIDNDGVQEIISATNSGKILVYRLNGIAYESFPINYEHGINSSPIVVDIDNDQDDEIVIGTTASLAIFDIKEISSMNDYWYMYQGNIHRTGVFKVTLEDQLLGDLNEDLQLDILDIVITVNIILDITIPTEYQQWAGDVNADNTIDILDIIQLVNLILE